MPTASACDGERYLSPDGRHFLKDAHLAFTEDEVTNIIKRYMSAIYSVDPADVNVLVEVFMDAAKPRATTAYSVRFTHKVGRAPSAPGTYTWGLKDG